MVYWFPILSYEFLDTVDSKSCKRYILVYVVLIPCSKQKLCGKDLRVSLYL